MRASEPTAATPTESATMPKLKELQAIVGGLIERVPLPEEFAGDLWVNEEGRLTDLAFNPVATAFVIARWREVAHIDELDLGRCCVFGDALLIEGNADERDA
jgi:hypothetical protein